MSENKKELDKAEKSSWLQDPAPTLVEWTVRGISLLIIVGLLAFFIVSALEPAKETDFGYDILTEEIVQVGKSWHLPVKITNLGSKSIHELTLDGILKYSEAGKAVSEKVSFSIRLFGPGQTRKAVFVFNRDPTKHDISFDVGTYEIP